MEILFLTEGGENIGMGHISRCSALADGFVQLGHSVKMHIRGEFQYQKNSINYNYNKTEWFVAKKIEQLVNKNKIVVVDTYLAPQKILRQIAHTVPTPVFLIDSKLNYYPKGIVLFPSVYGNSFSYKFENNVHLLSGKKFLLFGKSMWNLPAFNVRKKIQKVGVSLGGYLNEKIEKKICSAVQSAFKKVEINIFGKSQQNVINQQQIKIHGFIPKEEYINKLFENDILIVNGGQSLNECMLIGIPAISLILESNQYLNAVSWSNLNVTNYLQEEEVDLNAKLRNILLKYKSYKYRKLISTKSRRLVKPCGAMQAANEILEYSYNQVQLKNKIT